MDFCSLCFDLQKQSILNFITREKACFARILTYCATHALPYPCTPTGVSCLSSELFCSLSACRKGFFDTLKLLQSQSFAAAFYASSGRMHPQGVCRIRKAAKPPMAALWASRPTQSLCLGAKTSPLLRRAGSPEPVAAGTIDSASGIRGAMRASRPTQSLGLGAKTTPFA